MGMFDTFWGEYKCPACGNIVKFEEQTKDYECILEDFYLGDYMDRGNRNYFYEFESWCANCHTPHMISLAIRRGQYVGIYFKDDADKMDIMDLENIEDGYWRNREYDRMCLEKLGSETTQDASVREKHVGDYINLLRTRWKIEEVWEETASKRIKKRGWGILFQNAVLYRVSDGTCKRSVIVSDKNILQTIFIDVGVDIDQMDKWMNECGRTFVRVE